MNFAKFFRTPVLQNTSERLLQSPFTFLVVMIIMMIAIENTIPFKFVSITNAIWKEF